jgi:branched-chain amino acid transport system substrate-binding protein
MRQRSPWWRLLAVLLGLSILAAACGDDDDEAESSDEGSGGGGGQCPDGMKIGFFGALTGDAANLGINIKNGAELAIDQWNEDNPDCEITLEDFDSQGDPAQAPALAQQAVEDDNIVAMVGPAFSGESRQANPLFDEAGLPIVTASATAVDLSEQGWTIFHRALANDGAQGPAVANYILNELGATKVAVIDDASEYGKGLADIVNTTLADGGAEVVATDSIDPTADDYSSTVNKVQAAAPEVVFYGGYYAEAGKLAKQLKDAGVDAQFVSGDGSLDPGFIESAGDAAAEGVVLTCPCAPSPDDFASAYEEAFDTAPGTYSPEAYDSANIILEAIKAGNYDRESINSYVSDIDYTGITKNFKFDTNGEVEAITIYAYTVQDGEIQPGTAIED